MTPQAGDPAVSDRYVRQERLGSGGFGVVWRAHDTLLRRDVALKEIWMPSVLDYDERAAVRDKVLREARAAARLSHPGLVAVYDVAEEDGHPVIVMELVDAPTLTDLVADEGPLDDDRAAAIGAAVLDALTTAHEQGVVHRDVKPANVMVHASGRVQLGDFGVASVADDPRVTGSGRMAGSPSYMSPEQAHGDSAGAAADLWGLGATLYFAVEGRAPFGKDTAIATLTSVVSDEPRPMERTGRLAPLIGDLLRKDPNARPSADEVRRRLINDAGDATVAGAGLRGPNAGAGLRGPNAGAGLRGPNAGAGLPTTQFRTEETRRAAEPTPQPIRRAPAPPPRRPPRRPVGGMVAIALVVVAALVAIVLVLQRKAADQGSPNPATSTTDIPAGWATYQDPATGFTIAHPPDWSVRTNGTLTDFRDPESGAYLRVDHQQPPGPSPEGAWQALESRFAAQNDDYARIRLTPTTYKGHRAAIWEFTYSDGGADLRAVDLGFIAGDYGFALNFQTHAEDWERLQPVFDGFKQAFEPPA